jgi:type IV pilus assembly protein PilQ
VRRRIGETELRLAVGLAVVLNGAGVGWAQSEQDTAPGEPSGAKQGPPQRQSEETSRQEPLEPLGWGAETEQDLVAQPAEPTVGTEIAPAEPTAEPGPAAGAGAVEPTGRVSIDFKDADIRQVLRVLSLKSGVDIVAGPDVEGLVTIKLTDVPWQQALDVILRTYGFTYERKGDIIRVLSTDALEQEALDTEVFLLNYAKAKEVPDVIKEMLSDRGKVKFDERTNTVIVTDVPATLSQIAEVMERLDQRTAQVLIESKIIETKLEKDENLGIRWADAFILTQTQTSFPSTLPFQKSGSLGELGDMFVSPFSGERAGPNSLLTANPTSTLGSIGIGTLSSSQLTVTLNALKQRSHTRIVSNPTLTVLDNQSAQIHIGEEFPVPNFSVDPETGNTTVSGFDTKTVGTILTVTPHVNPSKEIVLDLQPAVISVGSNATFSIGGSGQAVTLPRFTTQTVTTQVRIKDGHTIALGGLVKENTVRLENKVPFLGDLPLIGLLFRNTQAAAGLQQDLLIFVTVKLEEEAPAVASTSVRSLK